MATTEMSFSFLENIMDIGGITSVFLTHDGPTMTYDGPTMVQAKLSGDINGLGHPPIAS